MEVVIFATAIFLCIALLTFALINTSTGFWTRYQTTFVEQARFNLADMFLFIETEKLFKANIILMVVVPALLLVLFNPLIAAIALVAIMVLPRKVYSWLRQRRIDKIQSQLPDALMMMSGTMKAGLGFGPALESLVHDGEPPLAQEFGLVLREQHMGVKLEEGLGHFAERVPVQDVQLFVSAVNISREVGGNLAESLGMLAETLRRRLIMEGKVKSLTAQGRLQGIVMAMLPVALIAFLAVAYPETMRPMFNSWAGWVVISLAAVMEFLGYKMCQKIMTIDV